jgi:hypothetical protein
MTLPQPRNDCDGQHCNAWRDGHGVGYNAARARFEHPIYPVELTLICLSIGAGIGAGWYGMVITFEVFF